MNCERESINIDFDEKLLFEECRSLNYESEYRYFIGYVFEGFIFLIRMFCFYYDLVEFLLIVCLVCSCSVFFQLYSHCFMNLVNM
jgi:hypothetical protein